MASLGTIINVRSNNFNVMKLIHFRRREGNIPRLGQIGLFQVRKSWIRHLFSGAAHVIRILCSGLCLISTSGLHCCILPECRKKRKCASEQSFGRRQRKSNPRAGFTVHACSSSTQEAVHAGFCRLKLLYGEECILIDHVQTPFFS